jgi:hypothetical protein
MLTLLLVALIVIVHTQSETCSCTGSDCPATNDVSVGNLCASSVCINGNPVPPPSNDPCVVVSFFNGQIVRVPIPGCCTSAANCTAGACQMAGTCVTATGQTVSATSSPPFGTCQFEQIVPCCEVDNDCQIDACHIGTCDGGCGTGLGLFFSERDGSHNVWSKRNVQVDALLCKTCTQELIPKCCLTSGDCASNSTLESRCDVGELPICDVNHRCVCGLIPPPAECTVANVTACAPLLARCHECGATAICDDGHCKIVVDTEGGAGQIFCAVNNTENNFDRDGFFHCGIEVTSQCNSSCPAGTVEIDALNFDASTCTNHTDGTQTCTLHCNCDHCDHDAGTIVDHQICCEAQVPNVAVPECGGEPRPVCYSYTPANTTEGDACKAWGAGGVGPTKQGCTCDTSTATFDCNDFWTNAPRNSDGTCPAGAGCVDNSGIDVDDDITTTTTTGGNTRKRQQAVCNSCGIAGQSGVLTPDLQCLRDCDQDGNPVCPPDTSTVTDCCANIVGLQSSGGGFFDPLVVQCCKDVATYNADSSHAPVGDQNAADLIASCNKTTSSGGLKILAVPFIANQCQCPSGFGPQSNGGDTHQDLCECASASNGQANDYVATCGNNTDNDGDGVHACGTQLVCVAEDPNAGGANIGEICDGANLPPPDATNATCDCNDNNAGVQKPIACFADADGDGFVDCTTCDLVCMDTVCMTPPCPVCPDGKFPLVANSTANLPLAFGGAKVRAPLRGGTPAFRNQHGKRATPAPPPAYLTTCPAAFGCGAANGQQGCDCCDQDPYVYPGSPYCSVNATLCGGLGGSQAAHPYDYDCDCQDIPHVVCDDGIKTTGGDTPDAPLIGPNSTTHQRFIRQCQTGALNDNGTLISNGTLEPFVFSDVGEGMCGSPVNGVCTTMHGWCTERKRSIGSRIALPGRKRASSSSVTIPAPDECNGESVIDPSTGMYPQAAGDGNAGACFEYLSGCLPRNIGTANAHCACDCDVCVVVEQ